MGSLQVQSKISHRYNDPEHWRILKFPCCKKFVNSPVFRIVISMADFALDLKRIGLLLIEYIPVSLFVTRPRSGKSSLVFCLNESSWSFWCLLFLDLVLAISFRTLSSSGLCSVTLLISSLVSLFNWSSTDLLRDETCPLGLFGGCCIPRFSM